MKRTTTTCAVGVLALAAALLAGCGGSGSSKTTTAKQSAATVTNAANVAAKSALVIGTYKTPEDGTLITGESNRTLYVFKPDEKSTSGHDKQSTCYGACTAVWPPVTASATPSVSGKASSSLIGLTTRRDGTKQVTYNGMPLYYYAADTKAGQAAGNHLKDGFGLWVGMLPSGKQAPDGAN